MKRSDDECPSRSIGASGWHKAKNRHCVRRVRNSRWVPALVAAVVVVALLALGVDERLSSGQAVALMLLALLVAFFTRQYGSRNKR